MRAACALLAKVRGMRNADCERPCETGALCGSAHYNGGKRAAVSCAMQEEDVYEQHMERV